MALGSRGRLGLWALCASAAQLGCAQVDRVRLGDGGQGVDLARPPRDGGAADLAAAGAPDLAGVDLGPCGAALSSLSFGFEAGAAGFTHAVMDGADSSGVSWPYDEWQVGTPSGPGPGACHVGSGCFGTYLAGNYVSCERAALRSPKLDLSQCAAVGVKLVFYHYYDFFSGTYGGSAWADGGFIELSADDGASWSPVAMSYPGTLEINPQETSAYSCVEPTSFYAHGKPGYTGASAGWQRVEIPIVAGLRTAGFAVRFVFASGVSSMNNTPDTSRPNARPGWYIDDLSVVPE
jgi:hypothetical protein